MAVDIAGTPDPPQILGWLLLGLGGFLIVLAAWLLEREVQLRLHAVRELPGRVIGYESIESSCDQGDRTTYPCTKYRVQLATTGTDAGIPIERHSYDSWSTSRPWAVGSQVTLLLQPDGRAWLCTWMDLVPGFGIGVLGGGFIIFGLVGIGRIPAQGINRSLASSEKYEKILQRMRER